jgi:signal transduction histidine kinase
MAHDLKSLLTPVSTFLQLCRQGPPGPELIQELLPMALTNLETVDAYVRQALFFSQHHTPQFAPRKLAETITKAAAFLATQVQRKKLSVKMQVDNTLFAELDEVLGLRLISNLLSNAINASTEGATITIKLHALNSSGRREWLRLQVADEGRGIAPERLQRIFQLRLTPAQCGESGGSGLGLPICRKIVQLHGGRISLTSELGRGATVTVDLPAQQLP